MVSLSENRAKFSNLVNLSVVPIRKTNLIDARRNPIYTDQSHSVIHHHNATSLIRAYITNL